MPSPVPRLTLLEFGELSLGDVLDVAQLAEELGFSRFWLAEHLGLIENALLLTTLVAGSTSRIRVGPAGVLLRYHAARAVSWDALYLQRIFGRIDLGLAGGRHSAAHDAPYLDGRTDAYAPETFEEKLRGVARALSRHVAPQERPELWILGATESLDRGKSAARLHAHFSLSLMHVPTPPSAGPIRAYRDEEARLGLDRGHAGIAVQVACVESERERLAHVSPHPGVAGKPIVGTGAECRARLEELCHTYDVTEVAILEGSVGVERRSASIRMLAEAFGGLPGPPELGRVPSLDPGESTTPATQPG
jgi:alkanesulfonate monooxygenase SsuD/methylene tetrahydromethanopterin reductase-like flavin-dependent oxidoreductase (luciferase family)